jgi:hypothetical protein
MTILHSTDFFKAGISTVAIEPASLSRPFLNITMIS